MLRRVPLAVLCFLLLTATPAGASAAGGFWANRLTLTLGSGPTLPLWEGMKVMTGGRATVGFGLAPLAAGRIAPELTAGAWVILQEKKDGHWEGPTVIYVLPGLRGRLLDGRLTPFASVHAGLTINRAAYVGSGLNVAALGLDGTVGLEWVPTGWLDLQLFGSYYVTTGAPIPRNGNQPGVASFVVVGASVGVAIPLRR